MIKADDDDDGQMMMIVFFFMVRQPFGSKYHNILRPKRQKVQRRGRGSVKGPSSARSVSPSRAIILAQSIGASSDLPLDASRVDKIFRPWANVIAISRKRPWKSPAKPASSSAAISPSRRGLFQGRSQSRHRDRHGLPGPHLQPAFQGLSRPRFSGRRGPQEAVRGRVPLGLRSPGRDDEFRPSLPRFLRFPRPRAPRRAGLRRRLQPDERGDVLGGAGRRRVLQRDGRSASRRSTISDRSSARHGFPLRHPRRRGPTSPARAISPPDPGRPALRLGRPRSVLCRLRPVRRLLGDEAQPLGHGGRRGRSSRRPAAGSRISRGGRSTSTIPKSWPATA